MPDYSDPSEDLDGFLFLLANKRRRMTIRYLREHDSVKLRALANVITAHDSCTATASNVYVNLYQDHAPKLDNEDVIEYDDSAKAISRGPRFQDCANILACIDRVSG